MSNLIGRFKNWKTTLLGAIAAAAIAAAASLEAGEVDYRVILAAAGVAAIGSVLKDPESKKDIETNTEVDKTEGGE